MSIDNSPLIDTMILKADVASVARCVHHIGADASTIVSRVHIDTSTGLLLHVASGPILSLNPRDRGVKVQAQLSELKADGKG
jgi:hypothetical protein